MQCVNTALINQKLRDEEQYEEECVELACMLGMEPDDITAEIYTDNIDALYRSYRG